MDFHFFMCVAYFILTFQVHFGSNYSRVGSINVFLIFWSFTDRPVNGEVYCTVCGGININPMNFVASSLIFAVIQFSGLSTSTIIGE